MLKMITLVIALAASTMNAYPQERPLTVGEAMGVADGLRQVKTYQAQDKEGKPVALPNKFDTNTLWKMATDIQRGDAVSKTFQPVLNELIVRYAAGGTQVPPDKIPEYQAEVKKLLDAPCQVDMVKIRKSELKLEGSNQTSADVLSLLLPILTED